MVCSSFPRKQRNNNETRKTRWKVSRLHRCHSGFLYLFRQVVLQKIYSKVLSWRVSVLSLPLRACEIPRSVSKTVNNIFHDGLHLRPKKSNRSSGDDVRTMCCYVFGRKCKQLWKKLFTVFDTDLVRVRRGVNDSKCQRLEIIYAHRFLDFSDFHYKNKFLEPFFLYPTYDL